MKQCTVAVSQIRSYDTTFRYHRGNDPFQERDFMPAERGHSSVVLREISGAQEYQIVVGHLLVEGLASNDEVCALVYGGEELSDEQCRELILKCDATNASQLLTQYERALLIRDMGVSKYRAAQILGKSDTTIRNWLRGAELADEILEARGPLGGLTFSHMVELAEASAQTGRTLSIDDKLSYLQKAIRDDLSVKQFRKFLDSELSPAVESSTEAQRSQVRPRTRSRAKSPFQFVEGTSSPADPLQLYVDNKIIDAGLEEIVQATCSSEEELDFAIGPVSINDLKAVADCLSAIQSGFASGDVAA